MNPTVPPPVVHEVVIGRPHNPQYLKPGAWQAVCSCGWTGVKRLLRTSAERDAEEHAREEG